MTPRSQYRFLQVLNLSLLGIAIGPLAVGQPLFSWPVIVSALGLLTISVVYTGQLGTRILDTGKSK